MVNIIAGSKKRNVPAAAAAQSYPNTPIWYGSQAGTVWATLLDKTKAKAYSFQAKIKQNTAVAAIPVDACGTTIFLNA